MHINSIKYVEIKSVTLLNVSNSPINPSIKSTIKITTSSKTNPDNDPFMSSLLNVICNENSEDIRTNTQNCQVLKYPITTLAITASCSNKFEIENEVFTIIALERSGTSKYENPNIKRDITIIGATPIKKLPIFW